MMKSVASLAFSATMVGGVIVSGAPAHAAESPAQATTTVGFFSDRPMDPAKTYAKNSDMMAKARLASNTPKGYKLRRGNRRTDYIYVSSDVWAIEASCSPSGCRAIQQVKLQLKENVVGRQSKRWELTMYASAWSGPKWFDLDYFYECGVNIKGKRDKTCSTWAKDKADGPKSGQAWNGIVLKHSFGKKNGAKKFPMVKFDVQFLDGSHAKGDDGQRGEKFRGWDVCTAARSTKLCKTTGKGD